jgi:hypothetical protein
MTQYGVSGGKRSLAVLLGCTCALAACFGRTPQIKAQGLVYEEGQDDFGGNPNQNIFPAAGGALSTALDNDSNQNADNLWGFRSFGANATVYESNQENSPELRMHVSAPDGVYDVYAVYWSDQSNWTIRAGLTSNPGANTLYNRTGGGGVTAGVAASSAVWSVLPPNDTNPANDDNPSPFVDHTPAAAASRLMYLGRAGTATASGGAGFDVFVDDNPGTNDNDRSWFDGVAYVPAGTLISLTANVDRTTGQISISNPTAQSFTITGYSIASVSGSLNASAWHNITNNTANINDTDPWSISAPTTPLNTTTVAVALTEAETPTNNGVVLAANTTNTFDLGNIWNRWPTQDVAISLTLADGATATINPSYSGTARTLGDFNGDGAINSADYLLLANNLHKILPVGTTAYEAYSLGDITQDGLLNRNDFLTFRTTYIANNPGGGAAFDAMVASVPEPSIFALLGLSAVATLLAFRRSRSSEYVCLSPSINLLRVSAVKSFALLISFAIATSVCSSASAVAVVNWLKDPLVGGGAASVPVTNAGTASPTIGDGTNNNVQNGTAGTSIYGSTTSNVHIDDGQEAVLSGQLKLYGATGAAREFRFGMWKKLVNSNVTPTSGWLGYMALNASGTTGGRLEARNPDDPAFNNTGVSFVSDQGGGSIATSSGPAPATGSPLDNTGVGCSPNTGCGRYFKLAENTAANNGGFTSDIIYNFSIRVGRYGANENTVSASITTANPTGDYNNNGAVDSADYVIWRKTLGTSYVLPNRASASTGNVSQADYNTWRANFGQTPAGTYNFNIGGGLDFNGNPAPLVVSGVPNTYTPHLTFDFDRVGFLFGGALGVDKADLYNVDISVQSIQTLNLKINTTSGAATIQNTLASSLAIAYYEITSDSGALVKANWAGIDGTAQSAPDGVGWDAAGGSMNKILSELNLTGSSALSTGSSIGIGNIFNTSGAHDLRFFIGLTNGNVIRGSITYAASGLGAGEVPEPSSVVLLLTCGLFGALVRHCVRDDR